MFFGIVMLALTLPGSSSAAWLQSGFDPARTGNVPDPGPAWDDVVFRLKVAGSDSPGEPLVAGGEAFVLADDPEGFSQILRVDVRTGVVETVRRLDFDGAFLASDVTTFYVQGSRGIVAAVPRVEGPERWRVELDLYRTPDVFGGPPIVTACNETPPVLHADLLVIACYQMSGESTRVWAFNTADGTVVWSWIREASPLLPRAPSTVPPNPVPYVFGELNRYLQGAPPTGGYWWTRPMGLSVVGSQVLVSVYVQSSPDTDNSPPIVRTDVAALDMRSGGLRWIKSWPVCCEGGLPAGSQGYPNIPAGVTGDADRLYVELEHVHAFQTDADAPNEVGYTPIRPPDRHLEGDAGSGFALRNGTVFATSRTSIHRISPDLQIEWSYPDPVVGGNLEWGRGGLVIADDVLYARAGPLQDALFNNNGTSLRSHPLLFAIDADLGRPLWVHRFARDFRFAVSESVLVAWEYETGVITVLGRTDASIKPEARVSSQYPNPGEIVQVDLSATRPGQLGPATEFRADWGDGETTEWQPSPILEHRYSAFIDAPARFYGRNAAGQTASVPVTFYVGRAQDLTFLQAQFGPENQDRTFFLLGLVLTAIGALFGIVAVRRRRSRLARELRAIESTYSATHARPNECEAALVERSGHVRGLMADHRIDEAGAGLLLHRIEELRRGLRLGVLDERLAFLPHAMVKTLQGMLEDGRISEWEHSHFVAALDQDALLTGDQKQKVRRFIDAWFERDASAVRARSPAPSG